MSGRGGYGRVLGEGGYGSVVALDRNRVCKLQGADDGGRSGVSAAALREMVALRVLERVRGRRGHVGRMLLHPSGTVGIEFRRFPRSLLDWLRAQKRGHSCSATPASVLRLVGDLAAELRLAHAHGYVHRDVKPENVMLDAEGRAHLIDWGMSRFVPGAAPGRWTPGVATLWYRAPELFTGDPYGGAVDIWALGVLLVELVGGRCPFRGGTELDQLAHYVDVLGPPPRSSRCLPGWPLARSPSRREPRRAETVWAQVPGIAAVPGLADLVDRMLRWDQRARISADELLLHPAVAAHARREHRFVTPARPVRFAVALPPLPRASSLRAGVRRILLPGCLALGLPLLPVAWCAARFLWRVLAPAQFSSSSSHPPPPPPLAPLLCLDLAAKIVGTQLSRSLVSSRASTRRQVELVNRFLGVRGLADGTEQSCAPLAALRDANASSCSSPSPHELTWACLLLEAAFLASPERLLPNRDWALPAAALRALAAYLLTGRPDALVRCRAAARSFGQRNAPLGAFVLRGFVGGVQVLLDSSGRRGGNSSSSSSHRYLALWRRARPRYAALLNDLESDPVRRRRLAQGLVALTVKVDAARRRRKR